MGRIKKITSNHYIYKKMGRIKKITSRKINSRINLKSKKKKS